MSNNTLTADVVAKAALAILENELDVLKTVHRAYEDEFDKRVNGYRVGESIRIRRPADFTVRSGETVDIQDVIEGYTTLTVDQVKGVDFKFSGTDLTLKIEDLAERVMKPAMSNLVNEITGDVLTVMYKGIYNWAGTPGQTINSFGDFSAGPKRLDKMAVPMSDRTAVLSPEDHWAMLSQQTALYIQSPAGSAYRDAELGKIGGVRTLMSQVVPTHTNGTADNTTPLVRGGSQQVTYDTAKNTWTQTLVTDGWDASATITAGTVFTIADCYMVNPKTKVRTDVLQNFVVTTNVIADGSPSNATNLTISPPIITSGPHQTVEFTSDMDDNAITVFGDASTGYPQNMVYHKNTMAVAMVPMEIPPGTTGGARQSYKGISVRVMPGWDFITNQSKWRLDVLYGRAVIDPRLATRLSGTS